jgi:H+/Cl- antiporter ClcA
MSKYQVSEQTVLFISIIKWVVLASIIGGIVGLTTAGFIHLLDFSVAQMSKYWYILFIVPLSMFIVALIKKYLWPSDDVETTNQVIHSIQHSHEISWKSAIKAFFLPIITIAGGGSAGKEAPCADVGAATGSILSRWLRFDALDRKKLMVCGVSAGFAAVFGAPIAGAIFGVEVLVIGGMLYEVLLPSFIAGIVGYHVASSLGVGGFYHAVQVIPDFNRAFFISIIFAGIFFGLISIISVNTMKYFKQLSESIKLSSPIKALIGGSLIVIIAYIFSTQYLGLGLETIDLVLAGGKIVLFAFAIKLLVTAITLNFGGSGGLVTPVFFIGATSGVLFAAIFNLNPVVFAAIGMVAVLAGTANTPIAASILAIEAFGPVVAPYAAVACVISFLMTGHHSIFPNQILGIRKSSSLSVVPGKNLESAQTKVKVRKKGVLKYLLRAKEREEKFTKKYSQIFRRKK